MQREEERSFFGSLFDLSFTSFVTTRIIKVLYVLAIVAVALYALVFFGAGLAAGGGRAILGILGGSLFALIGLIYVRVLLELVIVVFRIGEHTATIAGAVRGGQPPPWQATTPVPPAPPVHPAAASAPAADPPSTEPTTRLDRPATPPARGPRPGDVPPPPR